MSTNEDYIKKNKVILVDDDKNTKLHYAAALGNFDEAQKEIATGRKIDFENYLGWTPLMMAIRNGNSAVVTLLLDNRADATKKNKFGMNAFLISVASGDRDMVEKLLDHLLCGGISRQSLQKILSPISLAIMFGQSSILTYLIERSFDVNAETPLTGITPAMFAAAMTNHAAIKILKQHNADMKKKNYLGKTVSEILESRTKRTLIDHNKPIKQPRPHLPVIVISPHTPNLQLTPDSIINNAPMKRSSNTCTPNFFWTPSVSPITPQFLPHAFFPPNFDPAQFLSPGGMMYPSYYNNSQYDMLNNTVFSIPSPQVPTNYA